MKNILTILVLTLLIAFPSTGQASESFDIAATVNKSAISESDVNDRLKLIFASSGMPKNKQDRDRARTQALNVLIEEELKIQEAERQNLNVTDEEIDQGFASLAQQNNMSPEEFSAVLQKQGIPKTTLLHQIKSQVAWVKIVKNVLRPKIDVSENDVNAKMDRMKDNIGATEYNASEIFLPVSNPQDEEKTKRLALKIISEINAGRAPFELAASQFSQSESAGRGGSLGWVKEEDLPKELGLVLKSLDQGQISTPVRGMAGYHILTLKEIRTASTETIPSEDEVLNSIGLERLERLSQRYLSDIKSAAFIDRRG